MFTHAVTPALTSSTRPRRPPSPASAWAGPERIAGDVCLMAEKEGLTGHAASVKVRLQQPASPVRAGNPIRRAGKASLS